jgi:beta-fructofuranosidase
MTLPANKETMLPDIHGGSLEINAEIDPKNAPMVELNVLRSPNKEEFTRILLFKDRAITSRFMPPQQKLSVVTLDGTRASQLHDVLSRPPETASVLIPPDEPFKLRVFVDRSIVEVFINGRQCLAIRVHPGRADSIGVSLLAQGQNAELKSLTAWPMKSIFE